MGRLLAGLTMILLGLSGCARETYAEPELGEVQVASSEWSGFMQDMQRGLGRIVPQSRGDSIESIRLFCAAEVSERCPETSAAGRIGLRSGDYIVGINSFEFPAKGKRAGVVIGEQLRRSAESCRISFTVKREEELLTASAACSDSGAGS
jgi:hypothetical protein